MMWTLLACSVYAAGLAVFAAAEIRRARRHLAEVQRRLRLALHPSVVEALLLLGEAMGREGVFNGVIRLTVTPRAFVRFLRELAPLPEPEDAFGPYRSPPELKPSIAMSTAGGIVKVEVEK